MKIVPAKKITGKVSRVLKAEGDDFVSQDVDTLDLTYDGIRSDYHAGLTRASGAREPWYPRGTEMRNERQLSILSEEELAQIADTMGVEKVDAGWIGANLVMEGIPNLTYLPPRTLLMFDGGVTIRVDGDNGPCKYAGAEIARNLGETAEDLKNTQTALNFVKAAQMKRGLVGWVEREGVIKPGEGFTARIWHQWIYE
ncbi:MAG: molybdenum cofactor sulfurase [Rhizobiaceae bacterium]|nr:molybdenum cofactor sulfurase [Rhizobiaceae bacterium]